MTIPRELSAVFLDVHPDSDRYPLRVAKRIAQLRTPEQMEQALAFVRLDKRPFVETLIVRELARVAAATKPKTVARSIVQACAPAWLWARVEPEIARAAARLREERARAAELAAAIANATATLDTSDATEEDKDQSVRDALKALFV